MIFKSKPKEPTVYEVGELASMVDEPKGKQLRIFDGVEWIPYVNTITELSRLRNGIQFIMNETQDDETWDYLNRLLQGTESEAQIHRFDNRAK